VKGEDLFQGSESSAAAAEARRVLQAHLLNEVPKLHACPEKLRERRRKRIFFHTVVLVLGEDRIAATLTNRH
jgi:hypothetical protein